MQQKAELSPQHNRKEEFRGMGLFSTIETGELQNKKTDIQV